MKINIYSSGKERDGGYSGVTVFAHEKSCVNVSHCGTAAVASTFHKMYILTISFCKNHLVDIQYIAYDDCEDYKIIKRIIDADYSDNEKSIQLKKMILSKIKIGKNFNIDSFIEEIFLIGIVEGKKQKTEELKKVLGL